MYKEKFITLNKEDIEDIIALTPMQEGMLFYYLKNPASDLYFEQLCLEISGEIDVKYFEQAWNSVVENNEMLRTVFRWEKMEKPIQVTLREHYIKVRYYDLSNRDDEEKDKPVEEIKTKDKEEKFDLHCVPFRVTLITLEKHRHVIIISNHHILYDGWSNGIILEEFFNAYHDLGCKKTAKKLVKTKFKDYIRWRQNQDEKSQEKFWKSYLKGFDTSVELSVKRSRGKEMFSADNFTMLLGKETTEILEQFLHLHHITLTALLSSAWGLLLQKYNNTDDVIFGTTVSGRTPKIKGIENIVGLFINTPPLRVQTFPGEKISHWLKRMNQALQIREPYGHTSLVKIKEYSELNPDESIFDTIVVIENYPLPTGSRINYPDRRLSIVSYRISEMTNYDLTVLITVTEEIKVNFIYNAELLTKDTIERLGIHFSHLLEKMVKKSHSKISEIDVLSDEETARILFEFNRTNTDYPANKTVQQLFEEQVEKTPDNIAVDGPFEKKSRVYMTYMTYISYRELNEKSNQMAHLLQQKGTGPDTIVGIVMERSIEMIIGIFGILKAGGAYLPIDPQYPEERIKYMLEDSSARILLKKSEIRNPKSETNPNVPNLNDQNKRAEVTGLDFEHLKFEFVSSFEFRASNLNPSNLAYIIYTSGTTGKPKGVMINHQALVNRLNWMQNKYLLDENDTILHKTPITFDVSVWEIFWWSIVGAKVCLLVKGGEKDPGTIVDTVARNRVTVMHFVPSMLTLFLEYLKRTGGQKRVECLRQVVASGEELIASQVKAFKEILYNEHSTGLDNLYGPTEATIDVSYYNCFENNDIDVIPIGKPIDNIQLYILDKHFHLQPIGIAGELCIAGVGLARGYLNRPELTAEKFSSHHHSPQYPISPSTHLPIYKTGDLARWFPDGNIEFLGRWDLQVKVRGFRIELGEIQSQLLKHEKVREAVVIGSSEGNQGHDQTLYAYIVYVGDSEETPAIARELRTYLSQMLPDYMIPAYFVPIEQIPLTPNGKVDRKALPEPETLSGKEYAAPGSKIEKTLVGLWSEVLGVDKTKIGVTDGFLEWGGHSLKAIRLVGRIHKEFNVEVPLSELYNVPTVRGISGYIEKAKRQLYQPIEPTEDKEYYPLVSTQKQFFIIQHLNPADISYNISESMLMEGRLSKEKFEMAFRRLIDRHESLRTSFHMVNGEPVQRIHQEVEFEIRRLAPKASEDNSDSRGWQSVIKLIENFIKPFDLSRAPLLRIGLIDIEEEKHVLVFDTHHIVMDGVSLGIFLKEFQAFYNGGTLPSLLIRYKDYASWTVQGKNRDPGNQIKVNSRTGLAAEKLNLSLDHAGSGEQWFEGSTIEFEVGRAERDTLLNLAKQEGTTLFMVLLSIFNIFLAKISGQENIVVGSPTAGRRRHDLEGVVGLFIKTVVLQNFPIGEKRFADFLAEVKANVLDAFENQDHQYEELLETMTLTREADGNPLFNVMFVLQNMDLPKIQIPGLTITQDLFVNRTAKFDLTLICEEKDTLVCKWEYRTSLFNEETIRRFFKYLQKIISNVLANPYKKIAEIEIIFTEEKYRILYEFNDTSAAYPKNKTIHQLFAEQVEHTPDNIALVGASDRKYRTYMTYISYRELNEKSNQLAYVLKEKGIKPDTIVGIMVERSIELIIGLLGILKAGGAYLPIDPDYPRERIDYMLQDSKAQALLVDDTSRALWLSFAPKALINLSEGHHLDTHPSTFPSFYSSQSSSLAYIIYTSGTTGKPKGVLIQHQNVVRLLFNDGNLFDFNRDDVWTLFHSSCFDFSVWEIYGALLYGGKLVIIPGMTAKDPLKYWQVLIQEKVTVLNQTPSAFYALCNEVLTYTGEKTHPRYVIFGGEALKPLQLKEWAAKYPHVKLINMFGITETTVHVTYKEIGDREISLNISNIGKPIPTLTTYILDRNLNLLPVGVAGELCVGGAGVSRGYLNRQELTAEKFCLRRPGALFEKTAPGPRKNFSLEGTRGLASLLNKVPGKDRMQACKYATMYLSPHHSPQYPITPIPHSPIYLSGDLARWFTNGEMEYLGRIDHQIKIRGFRVELGEIENQLLTHPLVQEVVVIAKSKPNNDKYLCAYIVPHVLPATPSITPLDKELRNHLAKKLPAYMIPSFFVELDRFPMTPNGKLDRRSLPDPEFGTPGKHITPRNEIEMKIADIWAEVLAVPGDVSISIDDKFFERGGNSLTIIHLSRRLHQVFKKEFPIVDLFRHTTIREQAAFLSGPGGDRQEIGFPGKGGQAQPGDRLSRTVRPVTAMDIAVIGMAGRFPGARDIHEFRDNLEKGIESIVFFADQELEAAGIPPGLLSDSNYIKARGFLQDAECFDTAFFDYSPGQAALMDPQVRLIHQCCWEALEDAGVVPDAYQGSIGLYAGASVNVPWMMSNIGGKMSPAEQYELLNLNGPSFTTLVSYKLNLKGPAISVQTACSTSLVAVDTACRSLLSGACHLALAGGVSLFLPGTSGYLYQEGMILSPDGHCRAFDAKAAGTMTGSGVGMVVLKPLDQALADEDHIYGVIKGSATNNDGLRRVGYTAPSVEGQAEVIRSALAAAGIKPETIGYIETHGTGTPLGDPVEIEGLKLAFNTSKRHYCALGSVKPNIGHLDAAAGIAGLIKALLALKYHRIPPTINFETPNPAIDFDNSPFYVNTCLAPWKEDYFPRRAGVSSFGIGGTNAHVVLEEWHSAHSTERTAHSREHMASPAGHLLDETWSQGRGGVSPPSHLRDYQLILLSAKTPAALDKMTINLASYFQHNLLNHDNHENPVNPGLTLADAAYTLQQGRKAFKHRRMLVCRDTDDAVELLSNSTPGRVFSAVPVLEDRPVVFMFPGQGSQYVNMGLELYEKEPVFREEMNRCFEILNGLLDYEIKEILYPFYMSNRSNTSYKSYKSHINRTEIAQPVLFSFEYALAKLLMSWGIRPAAMIGHSIGEYTAAHLSGVMSLEDTLKIAALRGRLMQQAPSGSMLSVPLPENKILSLLEDNHELFLAAVNSTAHSVVSGSHQAVDSFEKILATRGIETRRLHTSHAFHSAVMESILAPFEKEVQRVSRQEPQIPYISNVTGEWLTGREVAEPGYWSRQLRHTVRFADGLGRLFQKNEYFFFLEVGPGKTLTTFARQHREKGPGHMMENLVRHPGEKIPDILLLVTRVGQLWLHGKQVDWSGFHRGSQRRCISLPTYPFERRSFHMGINKAMKIATGFRMDSITAEKAAEVGKEIPLQKKQDMADWFYIPSWKRSPLGAFKSTGGESVVYLVFADSCSDENKGRESSGLTNRLVQQLKQTPGTQEVILVGKGDRFAKETNRSYQIRPGLPGDYDSLFNDLAKQEKLPHKIVHLWTIANTSWPIKNAAAVDMAQVEEGLDLGFYSLLYTARAIGKQQASFPVDLTVVTPGIQEVTDEEYPNLQHTVVLGAVTVIPQEYPTLNCRCIDIAASFVPSREEEVEQLTVQLLKEISQKNLDMADPLVAYRKNHRWVRRFDPLRLEQGIEERPLLRERGVYLVTGGLGAIGRVLAEYLAVRVKARLILIGRSPLPPGDSRKTRILKHLEALGAEVMIQAADAADESQMDAVIQQAVQRFGCINGVFHAANVGIEGTFHPIRDITRADCQNQFHPKIKGVLILEKVLRKLKPKPDFCFLMSSLASVLGGLGFAAYSAANAFMDAFTLYQNRDNDITWVSVNWDAWQLESKDTRQFSASVGAELGELAITREEGTAVFERILSWGAAGQVVHSTAHLQTRIDRLFNSRMGQREIEEPSTRPHLSIPYIAPRHALEQSIARIWESFFGFKPLGVYDDFYELGGDSLKAVTLASKIQHTLKAEVPLTVLLETPTIEGVAAYITNNAPGSSFPPIQPVEKKEYYALSSAQKRLFFLDRLENIGTSYHIPIMFKLIGFVDKERIKNTFLALIQRHETLRTSFHLPGDEPVQKVHDEAAFKINEINQKFYPFNLSQAPLLRAGMRSISEKEHLLLFEMHHIISDGISIQVLLDEFLAIYSGTELPVLNIQYKDFAAWQNHLFETGQIKAQTDYWLNRFTGIKEIPVLNLPVDYPRPTVFNFKGDTYKFKIVGEEVSRLKKLSTTNEVTLFMNVMAVFNVLLFKYTGQFDIVVGSGIAGRRHANLQRLIGLFVNILALRSQPDPDKTYLEFLKEVKKSSTQAFENQDMQFEELVDHLELNRDVSRNPLFDVCLVNLNFEQSSREIQGLAVVPFEDLETLKNKTAKFDLTLSILEIHEEIHFYLEYYTGIFKRETIQRLAQHFKNIIKQVCENPGVYLGTIDMLTREEKHCLLYDFNDTALLYPEDKTIHRLFEEQVRRTPDNIAAAGPPEIKNRTYMTYMTYISYRELDQKANQLAHQLIEKGIQADTIVAIKMERSLEMIVGLLGILKAGGAYLPIDPAYPKERIKYMLADSSAKILLTSQEISNLSSPEAFNNSPKGTASFGIWNLEFGISPRKGGHLAYVIYTSGSTGRPKGVLVNHRGFVNLIYFHREVFGPDQGTRMSQVASPGFDAMAFEVWPCLSWGAALHIADNETRMESSQLKEWLIKNRIAISFQPTVMAQRLLNEKWPGKGVKLKALLAAGERLSQYPTRRYPFHFYNLYGPTEDTVWTTWTKVEVNTSGRGYPGIGKPIANHRIYIIGISGELQPIGVIGELCISGIGVARGYLNRPELTAERFCLRRPGGRFLKKLPPWTPRKNFLLNKVPDKRSYYLGQTHASMQPCNHAIMQLSPHLPIYMTGDLARWLSGGRIEFIGRTDHQVKIRGFRIELGEIQHQLLTHDKITEAAVMMRGPATGAGYICAYIIANDELTGAELKKYLSKQLPAYMIPSYIVPLEKMPLTPNGKLDQDALPEPESFRDSEVKSCGPRNFIEKKLAEIWTEVLFAEDSALTGTSSGKQTGYPGISIDDNFFQMGGHSLKAAVLVSKIHKEMNIKVPLLEVFNRQTIRGLSRYIEETGECKYIGIEPVEKREYYGLSSAQKRLYFLQQMDLESTAYNIPAVLPLAGDIEIQKLESAIKQLVYRHESLRTSFIQVNNLPAQKVHEPEEAPFGQVLDTFGGSDNEGTRGLAPLPGAPLSEEPPTRNSQPETALISSFVRPFDLSRAPLVRSGIIKLPGGNYLWLVDMHHIISDGTSSVILQEDFSVLYPGEVLPGLRVQYKDFSGWQNRLFTSGEIKSQEDYWLDLYKDSKGIPRLDLPGDYKRPKVFTFAGDHYHVVLERDDTRQFKALASRNNTTLYMNILAVLNVLFYKYTNHTDIIIGTGTAGRPHADLQHIIGMFVNTLAMRNYPQGEKTYTTFLEEVMVHSVNAFENQDVQFEELVDKLDLERDASRNPLFDIMMVVQNFRQVKEKDWDNHEHTTSKFDMTFFVQEEGEEVCILIEYYADLFKKETIIRLAERFKKIVKTVLHVPEIRIKDINILTNQEKEEILYRFNDTGTDYPRDKTIEALFTLQVEQTPHHTAVVMRDQHLTYKSLDQLADRLAYYLFYETRVGPDQPVGILMDRSLDMIIAVVGIIKAGGAYVPLSPSFPEERLKRLLTDIDIKTLIGEKRNIKTLNRLQWECGSLETFLCLDSQDVYTEKEVEENKLMSRTLWEYVGQTSVDEVTGGGWNSSYTGEPIPQKEMDEYGDNILKKLEPLLHKNMRVLEIGAASGITMYRIAPRVALYYGTDLSSVITVKNQERVKQEGHRNIKLRTMAAHEIQKLEEKDFDLVIINSVIQCFNGHNYLRNVLANLPDLVGNKGYLFIGDIMDQDLKETLIAELVKFKQQNKEKNYITKIDWSEELFISRKFLEDLVWEYPWVQAVEFSEKIYTIENELTKFRYDALIHIDKTGKAPKTRKPKHKHQHDLRILKKYTGAGKLSVNLGPGNLAYVMFTSGSTGVPKGVMARHVNVVRLVRNTNFVVFKESGRLLQTGALEFDASTFEIWGVLLNGLTLHLEEKNNLLAPDILKNVIRKNKITMMWMTASYFNLMLEADIEIFAGLEYLLVGGEALSPSHINRLRDRFPGLHVINGYGPTENVTFSTTFFIDREYKESIPIGKPIANSTAYIVDRDWNFLPVGTAGELLVGGDGVARGYLNDPELTAEKFCLRRPGALFEKTAPGPRKNFSLEGTRGLAPLLNKVPGKDYMQSCNHASIPSPPHHSTQYPITPIPHSPIYCTGDLARWFSDGNIEFIGRLDTQVKIRGFRIELGEIENRLLANNSIKQAVVIDREDVTGSKQLAAYVVPEGTIDVVELREILAKDLPEYMIPSFFIPIENIPLTPNGKLDRQALPEPGIKVKQGYLAPGNETEEKVIEIWSDVLGISKESIGIDANFFHLGGHSLKATVLTSRLHRAFNVKVPLAEIFTRQTPRELSQYIESACTEKFLSLEKAVEKEYYALSSAQKRLYILQQMTLDSTAYNIWTLLEVKGPVRMERFQDTIRQLINRHESLRTSFHIKAENPVQKIHENFDFKIEYKEVEFKVDDFEGTRGLAPLPEESVTRNPQPAAPLINTFIRPFDLSKAPLLRVGLIYTNETEHILMVDMHHIVSDGTSLSLFIKEFTALYAGEELPVLRLRYKDYSEWQNRLLELGEFEDRETYWKKQFRGGIPVLNLPVDFVRPSPRSFAGRSITVEISPKETEALKQLALDREVTLYMVLLAVYNVFLSKLSGQEDIVVGTPVAGRTHADLGHIIGMFVNTLALRNFPTADKTFNEFLVEIKERTITAFENQDYPFETLVQRLAVTRDLTRNPLFDVMFEMQNMDMPEIHLPGLTIAPYPFENNSSQFDLTFSAVERQDQLDLSFAYCTGLFKEDTLCQFIGYLKNIVTSVTRDPNQVIGEFEIIEGEEKRRILYDFNDTTIEHPREKTIHQLFEQQVERTPDYIAIAGPAEREYRSHMTNMTYISYRELNERSNHLAHLLKEKGVKPAAVVGIKVERSIEMIIGIFAIVKAGGAYLPIDPGYPEERIKYMLEDSGAKILMTVSGLSEKFEKLSIVNCQLERTSLAYIIYTSGTTGQPKGTAIEHHSLVNRLCWMQKKYPLDEKDTILHKTPFTFDVSVWEIFWWSMVGAKVCLLVPGGEKDPRAITNTVVMNRVTVMHFVPSMLMLFLEFLRQTGDQKRLASLRQVVASGEALTLSQVKAFRDILFNENSTQLANLYGPTEATIDVSYYDCFEDNNFDVIPIGKPIDNIQLYILDKNLHVQPVGIAGELYIGGVGLARGYINRPELTAEKFVGHRSYRSYRSYISKKIYQTGDLARWLPDGNILFLGRIDHQVKIRGFRIELPEIEARLLDNKYIKEAVVITEGNEQDNKSLCAYVVSDKELDVTELKEYLSQWLPDYMVPGFFKQLDHIPLTTNGKVNRKVLVSSGTRLGATVQHVAPGTQTEVRVAGIWREILQSKDIKIGIHDNFFDLGGTSMDVIRVNGRLTKEFNKEIPIVALYKYTTIRTLAHVLDHGETHDQGLYPEDKRTERVEKGRSDKNKMREMRKRGRQ
jgi:amino acid adenylation domain-containing protein